MLQGGFEVCFEHAMSSTSVCPAKVRVDESGGACA